MDLEIWKNVIVDMTQVLRGVISPNMRIISVGHDEVGWVFRFFLEREDARDREEIEDVPAEFEALQSGPVDCRVEIVVTDAWVDPPLPPDIVIYRRREDSPNPPAFVDE